MLAQKISRRAAGAGFDWEHVDDVWEKVHEEIDELRSADPGSPAATDEVGDLLFTVVNVARKMGVDAESALRGTCARFVRRFSTWRPPAHETGARSTSWTSLHGKNYGSRPSTGSRPPKTAAMTEGRLR